MISKILIIDTGNSNIKSIANAIDHLNFIGPSILNVRKTVIGKGINVHKFDNYIYLLSKINQLITYDQD